MKDVVIDEAVLLVEPPQVYKLGITASKEVWR